MSYWIIYCSDHTFFVLTYLLYFQNKEWTLSENIFSPQILYMLYSQTTQKEKFAMKAIIFKTCINKKTTTKDNTILSLIFNDKK